VNQHLEVLADRPAWLAAATDLLVASAAHAIEASGRFTLALSGGSTPRALHEHLAEPAQAGLIDWSRTLFVFGDERCVPPADAASNYRMARESLLDPLRIAPDQVLRLRGEADPRVEAVRYARVLEELLEGRTGGDGVPGRPLDLVLLGLGGNRHTASLFPGLRWSLLEDDWVLAEYVEVVGQWRLSLGPSLLASARTTAFLVVGADKAEAVADVLEGPIDPVVRPAQAITQRTSARWLLDEPAAALLQR
jgi:6-phosphogluconolactonase